MCCCINNECILVCYSAVPLYIIAVHCFTPKHACKLSQQVVNAPRVSTLVLHFFNQYYDNVQDMWQTINTPLYQVYALCNKNSCIYKLVCMPWSHIAPLLINFLLCRNTAFTTFSTVLKCAEILGTTRGVSFNTTASTWMSMANRSSFTESD